MKMQVLSLLQQNVLPLGLQRIMGIPNKDNQEIPEEPKFRTNAFKYLHTVSNFGFHFFIVPFKIVISNDSKLIFQTSTTQKVLCMLNHICAAVECCYRIWFAMTLHLKPFPQNPEILYNMASEASMVAGIWLFSYLTWFQEKSFQKMHLSFYNFCEVGSNNVISDTQNFDIENQETKLQKRASWRSKKSWLIGLFCILSLADPVVDQTRAFLFPDQDGSASYSLKLRNYFMLSRNGPISWLFTGFLTLASLFSSILAYFAMLLFNLAICISVYHIGNDIIKFTKKSETEKASWQNLVTNYTRVKGLFRSVNKAVGLMMFSYIATGLICLSNYLIVLLDATDIHAVILLSIASGLFCYSLILAASAHAKVIGDYVFDNRERFGFQRPSEVSEVSIVLHDMSTVPLGLKAHTFTITYGFIVSIMSTVLTYLFVMIQFNINISPKAIPD